MPEMVFDVIVIGAGPTGENVADRAVKGGPGRRHSFDGHRFDTRWSSRARASLSEPHPGDDE